MSNRTFLAAASLVLALGAAPALAQQTDHVPPGNPCGGSPGVGRGNPCNGNNGNVGAQGNVRERIVYDPNPAPIDISVPPVSGRGAYISQIGEANVATVTQTAPNALAIVDQDGARNEANVTQKGSGLGYVKAGQTGVANSAAVVQDGSGQNVLYLNQNGTANIATSRQNASGAVHNGAVMAQVGNGNDMSLTQDGSDNRALLSQEGDGNAMTAVQNGDGNRLIWSQQGINLSNLQITQSGAQAMQITQTGVGR